MTEYPPKTAGKHRGNAANKTTRGSAGKRAGKPSPDSARAPAPDTSSDTSPGASASAPGERIAKVIARAGLASRREAEAMVTAGRVSVNGKRLDSPALNVFPQDRITVDDRPLAAPEPPRLWLYHKPLGLVTTMRDEKGRPTVFAALPPEMPRVVSVGRLDLNSEGLLLLTNDGALKRRLELPETGWLRKYRVRVHGEPDDALLEPLRAGITVEGEHFQPMQVRLDRQQGANAWLTIGIREGRNREIRRALQAVGLGVNRLIRTGYGPFQLGTLTPGSVEEVRPSILRDQLGIELQDRAAAGAAGRGTRERAPGRAAKATNPAPAGAAGRGGSPAGTAPGADGKPARTRRNAPGRAPHGRRS